MGLANAGGILNSADDLPEVATIEDIARLLRIHVNTARADLSRRPESLPPRMRLPGRRSVRFLKQDVLAWLAASSANGLGALAPATAAVGEGADECAE